MNAPIMDESETTDTSIRVYWKPITIDLETGGVSVTSYSLEWDQATGDWVSLVGESSDYLLLEFTVAANVIAGETFVFRLRAKNEHGWGVYSEKTPSIPSSVPD
jgi:hypothetical protein